MSQRKRTSLDEIVSRVLDDPPPAAPAATSAAPKRPEASPIVAEDADIHKHTTYLRMPVYEQLRRLAFDERRKIHDYLIEGLDLVFHKRGLPSIADLEKEKESQ